MILFKCVNAWLKHEINVWIELNEKNMDIRWYIEIHW